MKTTATTEVVSSSPGENGHWNTKWRRTTSCAGQKPRADWKNVLQIQGAGRESRKQPTPFVGIKPYGKCQIMVMKIALFTLSIACLCLCGCSKSRNDQENDQQQFDPLTAPIQEVQALQEKIKAKIKSEEAPFNKRIKEITDKLAGTSGEEQKAYLQAIADNGSLRESVTADLKMQLPSNILMDKYNNLMRGYRNAAPYPESINSYLSTNDFNTITQIVNVLNQISPLDAGTIEYEFNDQLNQANQGNAKAQAFIADQYYYGVSVAKDLVKAVEWYTKAASQGNADGECGLGDAYYNGVGGLSKDPVKAVDWYRKAADQGNADAQHSLGGAYVLGVGIAKDPIEGIKWIRKAADQGSPAAQCDLGNAYYDGIGGLIKDPVEAAKWWKKAADQGYPPKGN
jgi:hypothetical protein